ncbi:uncharacterized protein LOC117154112 isoform X1 [Bombus vancouverensis nearcticus]|uniref:Uncharacterized protein LOC117208121 n=2 Tax=Pyrobombus TaxID=144703 RepID=A0A6P8MR85_9HYME|nr:uncharacterized protein LOC117154112 [Bombus vancouverensis nearcticus]XP_033304890.1 uncharacterized protein LOC117208121 [Bombus bifarius]XP_050472614.1 uncharacterized protein LOC126864835 [Bombus huntii]
MSNMHIITTEMDEEISADEEEILVYVEFEGLVDGNVFSEKELRLDMIGIDTEHPIMQINGKFYEGSYEDVVGTYMFFTKNDNPMIDDPVFDAAPNFQYFAKTRKCLKMQRIFTKSRTEVLGDSENNECIPNPNTLKQAGIPFQYQEEALLFWKTLRDNRLNALHSYLEKQRIRQEKKSQGIILESESDEDNPFAIYNHKDEVSNFNKSIHVDAKKELSYCDNQIDSKCMYPNEINDQTSNTTEDNCYENRKKHKISLESESSVSKNDNHCLMRSVKGYKTKLARNKQLSVSRNRQSKEFKTKRILLEKHMDDDEVSSLKDTSDKSNIAKSFNSLEINENENTEGNNRCEIISND